MQHETNVVAVFFSYHQLIVNNIFQYTFWCYKRWMSMLQTLIFYIANTIICCCDGPTDIRWEVSHPVFLKLKFLIERPDASNTVTFFHNGIFGSLLRKSMSNSCAIQHFMILSHVTIPYGCMQRHHDEWTKKRGYCFEVQTNNKAIGNASLPCQ